MDLESRCRGVFQTLSREGFGGRFHLSSGEASRVLSARSSAQHALALRHLDPRLAADELRTLYAACQMENGLVMCERLLPGESGEESLFIEPPVAPFAVARLVLSADGGLRDLLECATRELDAIWGERLPPDTDLPVILHPFESGTPGSPLFDGVVEGSSERERAAELANLARSAIACGFDPERALRAGHAFVVEDPVFCGWFLLSLEEVQRAWEKLGDGAAARKLAIRSSMIAEAIGERLWWEGEDVFVAVNRQRDEAMCVVTAGGVVPAASRTLLEDPRARRAVDRHLAPGISPLWGPRGISFNPIVRDGTSGIARSTWRGNSVSGVTQYWGHLALSRVGRAADARMACLQLEELVREQGFREFYDAVSGAGGGAGQSAGCTAPTLLLEMRAEP